MRTSDLFGAGVTGRLMLPEYSERAKIRAWFQNRHAKHSRTLFDEDNLYHNGPHSWKVPYGIRYALRSPLLHVQIVNRYPWGVTWRSPKSGKRLKKHFASLATAIEFIATKAQYVDPKASIYSRQTTYHIPPALRGKIPNPYKWCPRCITARKFKRSYTFQGKPVTIHALRKEWNPDKERFEWRERTLALLTCPYCGTTNRDATFRASNQPWEKRKFAPGVTRARKRKKRVRS